MAIWLNQQEIASLLTMPDAIDAVERAFAALARGDAVMPQRVGFPGDGGGGAAMPGFIAGPGGGLGVKVVTLFKANPSQGLPAVLATVLLLEPSTGQLLAVMDGGHLTAVRTGAASGVATKYLAREDARTLTLFGAGVQARTQLEAICAVRAIRQAWVIARSPESAKHFAQEMSDKLGIPVVPATDVRRAVEEADVIVTATSAQEPLFDGRWLQPGVHINGIGSHSPGARELDTATLRRARIVTDQTAACLAEAGDLLVPIQEGALSPEAIYGELGEMVLGRKPGRESEADITLFKSVGLAIQDVAVAARVYELAGQAGMGQVLR